MNFKSYDEATKYITEECLRIYKRKTLYSVQDWHCTYWMRRS